LLKRGHRTSEVSPFTLEPDESKNIWTDRKGTEYMWWNNVETKPGTGFPTQWENQDKYNDGRECKDGKPERPIKGILQEFDFRRRGR